MKKVTRWCAGLRCQLVWLGLLAWAGWAWALQPATAPAAGPASASPGAAADFAFVQPWFDNAGDAESIPGGIVTAMAQDARGLIWIGTQDGLVRYDGYRFRRFVHDAGDPESLAGNFVRSLWAAKDGRLWVGGNSDGLSVFDPESERFEHFRHDAKRPDSLGAGRISALAGDAGGGLWIATDQGLDHLPGNGKGFAHYRHDAADPRSLLDDKVRSLLINRQGRLFVGSTGGLQRLAPDGKGFEPLAEAINVQSLFEAQDGKLWLGTADHGAAWLAPGSDTPHWLALNQTGPASAPARTDALSHPWILGIAQVRADQIWLASYGGGINIVAADDGRVLQHLRHDPALLGGLANDMVKPMLLDRAGLLWVGTWGGGLQRCQWFDGKSGAPLRLRHGQSQPGGLSHPNVVSVLELANGQILFGSTGNGIDVFDRRRGLVGGHRADRSLGALPDPAIRAMAQTGDGTLWAGTQHAGVVRMPAGGREWQAVPGVPAQVIRLVRGRDGGLWAATSGGLARWQAGQAGFQAVPDENGKPIRTGISTLVEDRHGRVWAGGPNGLWVMEPGGAGFHAIHPEPGRADSLVSDKVGCLLVDSRGRLWLATDKGLERLLQWDGGIARFEHVSAMLGRPGQALGDSLLEDKAGRIWSDTAMIDPLKMRMMPLGKADGVGPMWLGSYGQTRDGLLIFGGPQGASIIDPVLFRAWDYAPPLVATELKINGKAVPPGALASARPGFDGPTLPPLPPLLLTLTPEQRNFSLEFAALDYSAPKKNRYSYRLLGYDRDWTETDSEHRSAAYGNLWPGRYTLQVRGSNRMGDWSPHKLSITVRVLPAFWQTGWFLALLSLALCGAVAGGYRWRLARIRAEALALQTLVAARTADILKLGEIGKDLTSTLDTEQAFARVYQQVSARIDAHVFSIGVLDEAQQQIVFVYEMENSRRLPHAVIGMDQRDRPAVWCVRERRELIVESNAGLLDYVQQILPPAIGDSMETVVYLPLLVERQVIGCITVQSPRAHAYSRDQIEFLRVLASYTAIAVSNSRAHGELAAAHDDLAEAHGELTASHLNLQVAQRQLVQAEKMAALGSLVVGVSHEINTPVGVGVMAASSLLDNATSLGQLLANGKMKKRDLEIFVDESKKAGEIIMTNLQRAVGLIQNFKQIAVEQSGFAWYRFNIGQELRTSIDALRPRMDAAGVVCQIDCPDDLEYDGYADAFDNIVTQLADNALVHAFGPGGSGRGGTLNIAVATDAQWLRMTFGDDGGGIAPEVLDKIYEPFFTTCRSGERSGLGLNIVYNLVTQTFHGSIECKSEVGKGCLFSLALRIERQIAPG